MQSDFSNSTSRHSLLGVCISNQIFILSFQVENKAFNLSQKLKKKKEKMSVTNYMLMALFNLVFKINCNSQIFANI